jgi:hypothetical protein
MDELEGLVLSNFGAFNPEVVQGFEARVLGLDCPGWGYRFSEYAMSVAGDDSSGCESLPEIISYGFLSGI